MAPFRTAFPAPQVLLRPRVGRLSPTLLSTALVTRDPERVTEALEDYVDERPGVDFMLPQRVQWQQWKSDMTSPGANRPLHREPLMSVPGVLEAVMSGRMPVLPASYPGQYPMNQAALDLVGDDEMAGFDEAPVLFRDAPAQGRPIPTPLVGEDIDEEFSDIPLHADGRGEVQAVRAIGLTQRRVLTWLRTNVRER